jgi:hypothetical protein
MMHSLGYPMQSNPNGGIHSLDIVGDAMTACLSIEEARQMLHGRQETIEAQ